MSPLVSAVVPCRNEIGHIRECVESLLRQEAVVGGFEIIVADGMSDDGTREALDELVLRHPQLRVVDNPRRITPCGMNAGILAARGQWIAILGSHSRYAPDYLACCLEVARETGADNVGGAMRCEGRGIVQCAIAAAHHSPFAVGGAAWHNPQHDGPADTVFGGFYRRAIFDRIGLFDETLIRNQDDELNLRLCRSGGRIWHSPRIRSWYSPRASIRALFRQYYQYGYWKVRVIQKHRLPASWRHLIPGLFVLIVGLLSVSSLVIWGFAATQTESDQGTRGVLAVLLSLLGVTLGTYLLTVIVASAVTASRTRERVFAVLPAVFPCYHFGYGMGFLAGLWDFILRRKGPRQCVVTLTR
jgi:glycosyltransferase involved in cell wall biosynthesis